MKRALAVLFALALVYGGTRLVLYRLDDSKQIFDPISEKRGTIPESARILENPHGARSAHEVRWEWKIELDSKWDDYRNWVKSQLFDYRVAKETRSSVDFRKTTPGDWFYVSVERVQAEPLHVKATLTAGPD